MSDFRKTFKSEHNGSLAKDAAKIGGEKWKSLTEEVSCFIFVFLH
jgi:high mobility group protein B1